jgi:tetratricopeptide (TPR) repeat protein
MHRQIAEEATRLALERMEQICDPETPVPELARLLVDQYDGEPVPARLVDLLRERGSSPERLASVAEAMLAIDAAEPGTDVPDSEEGDGDQGTKSPDPSLTVLTFGAAAARAAGDTEKARHLLDQVLATADEPELRTDLASQLRSHGRLAEAIELLEARLREAPDDIPAANYYGEAIQEAFERVNAHEPAGACPCGNGESWQECCAPRERAALSRFSDRSGLTALSDALAAYFPGTRYGPGIADQVTKLLKLSENTDWDPVQQAGFANLVKEVVLLSARAAESADTAEAEAISALTAFATDPAVPTELAARAIIWREHIHYGLWRLENRSAAPGAWGIDLASSDVRYIEFPADLIGAKPRWAVWLGAIVPVDGIWRATGQGILLSPAEADAAAELIESAVAAVVYRIAGKPGKYPGHRPDEPMLFEHAPPRGVIVDFDDPISEDLARFASMTTGQLMPRIVIEVQQHRTDPPVVRNMDNDPMCLITARIAVPDPEKLAERLTARADFDTDPADPARLAWIGLRVLEDQRKALLAQAQAQLGEQGRAAHLEGTEGPQRWIRGMLRVAPGELVAEVNSAERLERFLSLLTKLGETPVVTDEKRIAPALHTAWPAGQSIYPQGAAPSARDWEEHWLEEPIPALNGRTPRQVLQTKEGLTVEALLRQFEYEADLLAAEGKSGIDTQWLRQELGLDDPDTD